MEKIKVDHLSFAKGKGLVTILKAMFCLRSGDSRIKAVKHKSTTFFPHLNNLLNRS